MIASESTPNPAVAVVAAAQHRLDQARAAVVDREKDVQAARAALPHRVDLLEEDPVLAAAMAPTPDELVMSERIAALQNLVFEAAAVWNREGLRVLASQARGGGMPLDEDPGFVAADQLLSELQGELNELRRRRDAGPQVRIFNASVKRFDDALAERRSLVPTPAMKSGLRAELARRVKGSR